MIKKIKYALFFLVFIGILISSSSVFATIRQVDVCQIGDNYDEPGTYYNNIYTVPVPDNISNTYIIAYDTFWSGSNNPTIFIVDFPNYSGKSLDISVNALGLWNIGGIAQTYSCSRNDLSISSFVSTSNFSKYRTDYADAGGDGLSILYSTKDIKINDVVVFRGTSKDALPDVSPIISSLISAVIPSQIILLLSSFIAFVLLFVFVWFGIRKIFIIYKSSISGKISI